MSTIPYNDGLAIMRNGSPFDGLRLHKFTYESSVMSLGDRITGDVYYRNNALAVTMQEYVEYDGVKFVLVNPPTIVREGMVSDNNELKGMTKYSFTFYHPMYQLSNFPFTDIAVSLNEQKYLSQNKTFSWIGNLFDMIAKLNKNLQGTQWVVDANINHYEQDGTTVTAMWQKAEKIPEEPLSFDKNYISDALKTSYDTWEIPFVIDQIPSTDARYAQGKRFLILFGVPSNEILDENNSPYVFQFGQGVGLKNNSRTPKNNKIVTRIIGYGAERNIPYGYPQIPWTGNQSWDYTINNNPNAANSYPIYDGIVGGQRVRLIKHPFTRKTLMPSIYADTVNKKVNPYATGYNPNIEIVDYYDADNSYVNPAVVGAESVEIHQFEDIYPRLDNAQIVGISAYSEELEDYITEAQFRQIINSEIPNYPPYTQQRMSEMLRAFGLGVDAKAGFNGGSYTYEWVLDFDEDFCKVHYGSPTFICDYTVLLSGHTPNVEWDDTMDDDGTYKQSYFKITLPQLSFDIYACASITEEMKINMRSGDCIGCTFNVQVDWDDYKKNFYDSDGKFDPAIGTGHPRDGEKYPDSSQGQITVIVQKDTETFGTLMPNAYQKPQSGDSFVILGISLPVSYITNAEQELESAAKEYMLENNVYYYDYPLKFDEHFLATHTSILAQMRNNTIVRFKYGDEPTMALYIKQMTTKYGNSPLPQYDITLTDDVEIVLNQIGQVTDDVSRMRVQVSELQKYYSENLIQAINSKLSKIVDDVCQGVITFQQGLNAIGAVIFSDDARSDTFQSGLDGRGWRVDHLGNAEFESCRVRSYLEVIELLVNRMQAQEGDTLFTDNDQIDKVDVVVDENTNTTSYILSLKEKYEGYITAQQEGNIIKGIINTLAAKQADVSDEESTSVETDGENKYYTSWMRIVETHNTTGSTLGVNQIRVVLYGDSDVPANKNFAPCELMVIARWGCSLNPNEEGISEGEKQSRIRRQRLFAISVADGRVVKYTGVRTPKLLNANYGVTIGELPDFVKQYASVSSVLSSIGEHSDWLYASGIVVGRFIKVDVNGVPEISYIDCGGWVNGGTAANPTPRNGIYLCNEYNETTLQYETHDVWHNGAKWRCLQHQPVTSGGVTTYYEPTDSNSEYWRKLEQGISGGETIMQYALSAYKTSRDGTSATAPTDISSSDWQDAPLIVTTAKPYLWSKVQKKDGDGNNVGNPSYMRLTGEESTDYSIEGALNTIKLGVGQSSTAISCVYTFYKKPAVSSTRSTVSCYYAVYLRSGSTFSLLTMNSGYYNHGSGTSVDVRATVPYNSGNTIYDAVVIYTFASSYYSTSPESQSYMAKKEIPIVKDGENSFVVDLENEMTNVALDENGDLVDDFDMYFKVRAFYGTKDVLSDSACTVSASCSDPDVTVTTTEAKTTGIRVQISSDTHILDTTEVSVTVTHTTYGTRNVIFTLAGVRAGANGNNAVLQELLPSRNEISFARRADKTLTPPNRDLALSIKKVDGDTVSEQTISQSGLTIRWGTTMPATKDSGTAWGSGTSVNGITWNSNTMQIASSVAVSNICIAAFNSSGTLVDMETIPIIKDGQHGNDGDDSVQAYLSPDTLSIPCGNGGSHYVLSQVSQTVTASIQKGGVALTVDYLTWSSNLPTGVSVATVSGHDDQKTITVSTSATAGGIAGGVNFVVHGLDSNNNSYSAPVTLALIPAVKGDTGTGERGKRGRFYYYAQEWSNSSTVSYIVSDAQAPYFLYNGSYWVFNPTANGTYTMAQMGAPSSSSANWEIMTNDFKYIITEAIFGRYAKFGSAIINQDWLLSANGSINGTEYKDGAVFPRGSTTPAYTLFNPLFPYKESGTATLKLTRTSSNISSNWTAFTEEFTLNQYNIYTFEITGSVSSSSYLGHVRLIYGDGATDGENSLYIGAFSSTVDSTIRVIVAIPVMATDCRIAGMPSGGTMYISNIKVTCDKELRLTANNVQGATYQDITDCIILPKGRSITIRIAINALTTGGTLYARIFDGDSSYAVASSSKSTTGTLTMSYTRNRTQHFYHLQCRTTGNSYAATISGITISNAGYTSPCLFEPHYAVDLLTGETFQDNAVVKGTIYANGGTFKGLVSTPFKRITASNYTDYLTLWNGVFKRLNLEKASNFQIEYVPNNNEIAMPPITEDMVGAEMSIMMMVPNVSQIQIANGTNADNSLLITRRLNTSNEYTLSGGNIYVYYGEIVTLKAIEAPTGYSFGTYCWYVIRHYRDYYNNARPVI